MPLPLIIGLHGGGGSGAQFESSSLLTPKALAAGYAIVYPDGYADGVLGIRTWNAGNCCGGAVANNVDDVNFIRQMIATLRSRYAIDARRIYATGHSNGAMLSYRLGCELSDQIAAIAPNAGLQEGTVCAPRRPVPVLHMHSKLDSNVPISGGFGSGLSGVDYPALTEVITRWVTLNACAPTPDTFTEPGKYVRISWTSCAESSSVSYYLTDDGGHSWPGGEPGRPGGDPASTAIDANVLVPAFFAQYALPLQPAPKQLLWLPVMTRMP
jgi:polyhydroxybutyrate depolymerase